MKNLIKILFLSLLPSLALANHQYKKDSSAEKAKARLLKELKATMKLKKEIAQLKADFQNY